MVPTERLMQVADKQEILEIYYRYCRGVDRGDADLMRSAYHHDAQESHGPYNGPAREFIGFVAEHLKNTRIALHFIQNVLIDIRESEANGEAYFYAIQQESADAFEDHMAGRYLDRFERREGVWKIASRKVVIDWSRRQPAAPSPSPALPLFAQGRRDKADALYTSEHLTRWTKIP
jgi:hypothetical protein